MRVYNCINNTKAKKVLAEIRKVAKRSKNDEDLDLRVYVNCREQGFSLQKSFDGLKGKKVAFSENRNSDDIVVYTGDKGEFEFNTNVPNERAWQDRNLFKYNDYLGAAKFIVKYLSEK